MRKRFKEQPRVVQGVMHCVRGVWGDVISSCITQNLLHLPSVNIETELAGLIEHPLQRDLREPALAFGVAPTHVGVYAGKPDLFDVLIRKANTPEILPEKATPFVNGDSVTTYTKIRILRRIWNMNGIPYPTDRAHRIPNSRKIRPAISRESLLKICSNSEGSGILLRLEHFGRVVDQIVISGSDQPKHVKHSR